MATIKTFTEILAWQKGHLLTLEIYSVTKNFPGEEKFRLVDQMCRAIVSFPSNIAEGFKRKSKKDSLRFYNIAESSLEEIKYQLLLAKDLKYIDKEKYSELFALAEECGKLLNGWVKVQK